MSKIKLIIADDHELIRLGLKNIIAINTNLELLQEFDNGKDALNYIFDNVPDLAILDIDMPGLSGLDVCKQVRENNIPTKILFLTMLNQESVYNKAREFGANGFLLKDFVLEELYTAIEYIFKEVFYVSNGLRDKLQHNDNNFLKSQSIKELLNKLTPTEQKILKLIALNLNSNQIAEKLFLSESTIKTHRKNITRKLELDNEQNSLLKFATKNIDYLK